MIKRSRILRRSFPAWKRFSSVLKKPVEVPHERSGQVRKTQGTDRKTQAAGASSRSDDSQREGCADEGYRSGSQSEAGARGWSRAGSGGGRGRPTEFLFASAGPAEYFANLSGYR